MLTGQEIVERGIVPLPRHRWPEHVQPNGIDLSLGEVWRADSRGRLGTTDADRALPARTSLEPDADGWIDLPAGTYGIRFAEPVTLPLDAGGLCFPRSSLLRMGAHIPTGVWDAGYSGRGETLLLVLNPHGISLRRGARIAQLVVWRLAQPAVQGYAGRYLGEGLESPIPTSASPAEQ